MSSTSEEAHRLKSASATPQSICFYCADQNPHRDRSRGITNYTLGLVSSLKKIDGITVSAVVSRSSAALPPSVSQTMLPFRTDGPLGRLAADHLHPLLNRKTPADVWHYPKGFLPGGVQVRRPKVGSIADTIIQYYADHYSAERSYFDLKYWSWMLRHSVARFDAIVTISEFSRRSIQGFAERHRLRCPPVTVAYPGIDFPVRTAVTKREMVVHLASPLPHKRTRWLLETWATLQAEMELPQLLLIGPLDGSCAALIRKLRNVVVSPPVSRENLLDEIAAARALILPSEIEGFGLPAVEAYFCGTPVMFVRQTAVAEVLGSDAAGSFIFDVDSFRSALIEIINMAPATIAAKARDLEARCLWSSAALRIADLYRSLQ